jgi:predicted NodU family carbamoyl transferase
MNILSIYASHDGSVTYVKNNEIVFHTQIDRYNRFKHYSFPVKNLIQELEKLEIDKIIISHSHHNAMGMWDDLINNSNKLKNIEIHYYGEEHHHLFHAYCALTWNKNIKNILVCDGTGSKYKEIIERESLFNFGKRIKTESNKIGLAYEHFTGCFFEHPLECGKTMAWSLHDSRPKVIQLKFEHDMNLLINKWNITESVLFTGGCAQNVLYNSKLIPKFDTVFCDPFNGDFGLSLGAANYFLDNKIINKEIYLGIPQEIDTSVFLKYKIIDAGPDEISKILLEEPVAIFQSRSEQGQRGLGNRSLLMSPLHKQAHDKLNEIKKREWFRPFACSILEEKADEWFDMTIKNSPHMMYVFNLKKQKEGILKAGLAIDKKSRIQTVAKQDNLYYYNLLKSFEKLTNIPVLLNTSLNLPGEVLVETIEDMKEFFIKSNLNYIYFPEVNKLIKK